MSTAEYINEKIAGVKRSFGTYRLLRIISEGATGVVVEAEHYHLGRKVALKTLNPKGFERTGMGVRELTEQFLHEARVLAACDHPNMLPIFDAGFARGADMMVEVPYLAVKLVEGGDLQSWVTNHGPIDNDVAIKILAGCALGLQALHKAGFVHRDMKPGNVLLDPDWHPLIADLSAASPKGLPPRPGLVVGTSGYLAPEHIRHGVSNEATDLYALGATMYYALTGKAPYNVEPQDLVLWAESATGAPAPQQERSTVDVRLSQVVQRALAPLPQNRYATIAEMIEDCTALQLGKKPGHASGSRSSLFWGKP
jgi:serine/threonine protein kinase